MKTKIILLMGVSSCGKTTVGNRLSQILGWPFFDGDSFHPPANVEKMRSGLPLTDEDRLPWLNSMRVKIEEQMSSGGGAIFACSALKDSYRQILMKSDSTITLIHLSGSKEKLRERATARVHQYMPASLLDSQFEALEIPKNAFAVSVEGTIEDTIAQILGGLSVVQS